MHFMNPVPVMKLVEIIRGLQTSDATYETIASMSDRLDKTSVAVNDFPGFVANRILMPMINEAIYTVYEGVASPEDVDTVMRSEEHTSELQSRGHLVCRLLLEKKNASVK